MKKISVYEYEGTKLHDITLFDLDVEEIEQYHINGLTFYETVKAIDNLISEYNLQPSDIIRNYVFDSEGLLKETHKETIAEYLQ